MKMDRIMKNATAKIKLKKKILQKLQSTKRVDCDEFCEYLFLNIKRKLISQAKGTSPGFLN